MYVCIYIYVCIYPHLLGGIATPPRLGRREEGKERGRQREREREREIVWAIWCMTKEREREHALDCEVHSGVSLLTAASNSQAQAFLTAQPPE